MNCIKKLLILLTTFTLGVTGFYLIRSEKTFAPQVLRAQEIVQTAQTQTLEVPIQKTLDYKPFFDSFRDDEGYFGWLIADKFKGMKEVWTILLERNFENPDSDKLVWSAMVLTQNTDGESNDDDGFHSVQIETEKNHLSFRTNKIRGIEYRFDGEFFKSGKEFTSDEKILKGTMEKIVKGKTVAKFTADFSYVEPHCFH